ncbi:MAG TPA: hypothetical protein VHB20_04090 [Verrucomicrobiae bacterium]|nr:hypothetical protein [Verrucomicrobiae bacterium]
MTKSELGFSGVLLSFSTLAVVFDFGFTPTVDRFIGYAMAGAKKLEPHGPPELGSHAAPNFNLLWELLTTTRQLYRYLTLILFVVLGIGGTIVVENLIREEHRIHPEFALLMPRVAWGLTLASVSFDIYSNWWAIYLRGLNEVRDSVKATALTAFAKLIIAAGLLSGGAGLLSLPLATILSSFIQRRYARVRCLQLLPPPPPGIEAHLGRTLKVMWPNSWRMGILLASTYLLIQANTVLCAHLFHLELTGTYTYSVQLMGYAVAMAAVWTATKWPLISQYQARRDFIQIRELLRVRIWLQTVTFLILGFGVAFVAPRLLHWVGKDKELLPLPWMLVLMFGVYMDMIMAILGTLIATGNRLPYVWTGIITNAGSLTLSLILLRWTHLGLGSFVLGPILSNAVFNYWYWPTFAARSLNTTLREFLLPRRLSRRLANAP